MYAPVSMFWKAVSTFVESSADVSMNDNPFFSIMGKVGSILISAHHSRLQAVYIANQLLPQTNVDSNEGKCSGVTH